MSAVPILVFLIVVLVWNPAASVGVAGNSNRASQNGSAAGSHSRANASELSEFDRLRIEGFEAVYSIDYKTARERFLQMTKIAPDHPAGYVYLANNVWLETLFQSRRLTTSGYTGGSFCAQDKSEDQVDQKRDREFN